MAATRSAAAGNGRATLRRGETVWPAPADRELAVERMLEHLALIRRPGIDEHGKAALRRGGASAWTPPGSLANEPSWIIRPITPRNRSVARIRMGVDTTTTHSFGILGHKRRREVRHLEMLVGGRPARRRRDPRPRRDSRPARRSSRPIVFLAAMSLRGWRAICKPSEQQARTWRTRLGRSPNSSVHCCTASRRGSLSSCCRSGSSLAIGPAPDRSAARKPGGTPRLRSMASSDFTSSGSSRCLLRPRRNTAQNPGRRWPRSTPPRIAHSASARSVSVLSALA